MSKIRFGIISGGTTFPSWLANCIKNLNELDFVQPALIIKKTVDRTLTKKNVLKSGSNNSFSTTRLAKKQPYYNILLKIDKRLWSPKAWENISLDEELSSVPQITCCTELKNYSQYFKESDIKNICSYNLDFILYCDFTILRGEILNAAKHGVWSFHHDDERKYRGSSSGIWEIYNNDLMNGVILQRLTEKLDAGIILKRKDFPTINYSLSLNYDQLLFESAKLPAELCKEFNANPNHLNTIAPSRTKAKIYKLPTPLQTFKLTFILLKNFIFRSPKNIINDLKMIKKNLLSGK